MKKNKAPRYGMTKVKTGEKLCWLSSQNRNGWSLGLSLGKKTMWLRNTRFASASEVKRAVKAGIVFIHVKAK